jgi:uncharacterized protein
MKTSDVEILIVPGFGDSGPDHWQTRWERKLSTARRVVQPDWRRADREQWAGAIIDAVGRAEKPVVLVAHSIAVAAVAHAAPRFPRHVAGAFLVGMSDWNRAELLPGVKHDFAPIPLEQFNFPSMLVASRTDTYCDFEVAEKHASAWGSVLIDAGNAGHINAQSGHGPWPEGLMRFGLFLKALGEAGGKPV